jgi:hypothetical protein
MDLRAAGRGRSDQRGPQVETGRGVSEGGYLLLDDSDRPGYAAAFELLAGWRFRRFVGVKDGWPEPCETGIFTRPSSPA